MYAYMVRQDGANFYLYDGSALEGIVSYPHRVRDFDVTRAQQARGWFTNLAHKWGIVVSFEQNN